MELLELYGQPTHKDWLRFLDEEILLRLPEQEKEPLATLAVAEAPVQWNVLAEGVGLERNTARKPAASRVAA